VATTVNAAQTMPTDEYIDLDEMARQTNMSRMFYYRKVATGDIPAVKLGRVWRVKVSDFQNWLGRQNPYATHA
jgi:excisionase family DNA binding protein